MNVCALSFCLVSTPVLSFAGLASASAVHFHWQIEYSLSWSLKFASCRINFIEEIGQHHLFLSSVASKPLCIKVDPSNDKLGPTFIWIDKRYLVNNMPFCEGLNFDDQCLPVTIWPIKSQQTSYWINHFLPNLNESREEKRSIIIISAFEKDHIPIALHAFIVIHCLSVKLYKLSLVPFDSCDRNSYVLHTLQLQSQPSRIPHIVFCECVSLSLSLSVLFMLNFDL